ncbi:Tll0287-like domain-containing protein [Dongia deserti]|uniref:Tll0287-like domain-containing protein n=1 Tax=Dongia deserti TaxID=2268030 RepID=UPI002548F590|nr:DUF3365 domain-containing protein [Dongia deserti]
MNIREPAATGSQVLRGPSACVYAIACAVIIMSSLIFASHTRADESEEVAIALSLAKMLQAGREVISRNQALINDPNRGDKGLTGDVVLEAAVENYRKATGIDPRSISPASRRGRLLQSEMAAIKEVVNENQNFINEKGVGFKGFIPAIFARLVTERLEEKIGTEVLIKVTAPPKLVRNRKSRPDEWEQSVIEEKFLGPNWTRGEVFYQAQPNQGRDAIRVMVPEYYTASCLSCHGQEKGEVDITGYPKEGASEGDLGGVISITLFRQQQ